jgi:hypothetical protein
LGNQKSRGQEIGNLHGESHGNDLSRPSVGDTWQRSRVRRYFGYQGFKLTEKFCHQGIASREISRLNQDHPSVGTRGGDRESIDTSGVSRTRCRSFSAFDFAKSRNGCGPSILRGHVATIEAFGKNPDRRVHRHIEIRRFANPEDKAFAHFGNGSSEIPKRWKAPLWGQLTSHRIIGISGFGGSGIPRTKHWALARLNPEIESRSYGRLVTWTRR